jgi:hypothetical protein
VYVYQSQGGWEIHVASGRYVFKQPLPERVPFSQDNIAAFMARQAKLQEMIDAADVVPIDLPCAGESFTESSPSECAESLEYLRGLGYHVPQYAIDALREEHA